jgi:hypothetical protein
LAALSRLKMRRSLVGNDLVEDRMIWVDDGESRIEDGTASLTSGLLTAILHPPSSILDRIFSTACAIRSIPV